MANQPNGVHHLAIATRDVKAQLDFFTDVVGMELVALYWMHGVENTVHAFVKMGETSTIAFVQAPEMKDIEPEIGVSHAGFIAGNVAPGVMQHLALNVDSEADLMAMRDRVRSKGHWVMVVRFAMGESSQTLLSGIVFLLALTSAIAIALVLLIVAMDQPWLRFCLMAAMKPR